MLLYDSNVVTHTQLHFEGSQYRASSVCRHFFKQPITQCPYTYLNILYLCSTKIYITLLSVLNHQKTLDGHVILMCSYMWGPFAITSMLKITSHLSAFYTVTIHFFQFMKFGSGVTFYKDQAKVKSGYHPSCTFCKINCYYLQAYFEKYLHLQACQFCYHGSPFKLRVLSFSQKSGPLTV